MRCGTYHPSGRGASRVVHAFARALVTCCVAWMAAAQPAEAHPFGMSSVNRYLGVELTSGGGLHLAWLLDFAELPAAQEIARLDRDGDGAVTPAEREAYLDALVPPIVAQWVIERNGVRVEPRIAHRAIEVPQGQNGLNTLRVLAELTVDAPAQSERRVTVHVIDNSYAQRDGVRDLRADDSDAARLVSAPPEIPVRSADGTTLRRVNDATFVFELRAPVTTTTVTSVPTRPAGANWRWLAAASIAWLAALGIALARRDVEPRVRVVLTVAFAIAATAARVDSDRALLLLAAFALTAALAVRPPPGWLARRVGLALVWALAFGGARALGSPAHSLDVASRLAARIAITLVATIPLAATTTITRLADALAGLPVPTIFAETTVNTVRGLALLRDEAGRIARARQLRAPDAGLATRLALFGSYAGTVFERGLARASRAELAYALRGGHGVRIRRPAPAARDIIAAMFAITALVLAARFA